MAQKNVLVIAVLPNSSILPDPIDPVTLPQDAVNGISNPRVLSTRVISTSDATLSDDIKRTFADVLEQVESFYTYDLADAVQYTVDFTLTPAS